ncbi:hypothetical protein GRF29_1g2834631 [Pseudopithomyces chartarum]|uniref:Uncharacterized protein n=1 Tax=Pseudopithomyces chartarum TaxID=1892770 RepID=A0AAN6MA49_9PLEO|nr:hypothetical protein GRF29_1g2834631 [Pseudopithomyces chartarum]
MFNNTLATLGFLHAGQVLSDQPQLNPLYISLGTNAYRIQSQNLGIPDHFAMFSTQSPTTTGLRGGEVLVDGHCPSDPPILGLIHSCSLLGRTR